MKTILALVIYFLAIAFITVCAAVIVVKLTFWPVCTGVPSCDGWTVAGLAGTILGVAATFLAILGALAVAAWWLELNKRVSDQVKGDVDKAKKEVTEQINKVYSDQVALLNQRMTDQINRLYSEQAKEMSTKFNVLLDEQQQKFNKLILKYRVTDFELQHLENFEAHKPFSAEDRSDFTEQLRRLISLNFIQRQPNRGFRSLVDDFRQHRTVNVKDHFYITEEGKKFLEQVK